MQASILVYAVVITFLVSCSPSTEITGSWKNPKGTGSVRSMVIVAMTDNTSARQIVESDLAAELSKSGIKTMEGMDVLPPSFTQSSKNIDKDAMLEKIDNTGVDAILTVALIDEETESRYVPGTYGYEPITRYGYYGRFWGYYSTWVPIVYTPGYYAEDKIYFIETNLYDASTEELLWSAQSETYNPNSLANFSKEFAEMVRGRMRNDGIIDGTGS